MQNDANPQQNRPVWRKDPAEALKARIDKINTLSDPNTSADEILAWGKFFLYLLLGYSALLGYFCYYKNFSQSFPPWVAVCLSVILPCAIEFGKNYCSTWAIRQPFFHGFPSITSSWPKIFIFGGLTLIGVATFVMSIRNSTVGSQQLSLMFSHERNAATFTPDTKVIDEQISATQKSIDGNRGIKWKGTVTYQAQKAIQSETKALTTLQSQRETSVQQQRVDWEKDQSYKTEQAGGVAALVLASGGWVELLQFLFLFLRVACEKLLDNRLPNTTTVNHIALSTNGHPTRQQSPSYPPIQNSRVIYFNRAEDTGQVQPAEPQNTVPQSPQTVAQSGGVGADQVLELMRQQVQREIANFRNPQAIPKTVAGRIHGHLSGAYKTMNLPDFCPSRAVGVKTYGYLVETVFPTLNEKGWPFEQDIFMCQRMIAVIPKKIDAPA